MKINPKEYLDLADASYKTMDIGDQFINGGKTYKVIGVCNEPSIGYYGVAFRSDEGQIVVSHRGTELSDLKDLYTDAQIADFNLDRSTDLPYQFIYAKKFSESYKGPDVTHTGHSLGGGLAQFCAANNKQSSTVFDAPPVAHLIYSEVPTENMLAGVHQSYVVNGSAVSTGITDNRFGNVSLLYTKPPDELSVVDYVMEHRIERIKSCFDEKGNLVSDKPGYWDKILKEKYDKNPTTSFGAGGYSTSFSLQSRYKNLLEYKNAYLKDHNIAPSQNNSSIIVSGTAFEILVKTEILKNALKR